MKHLYPPLLLIFLLSGYAHAQRLKLPASPTPTFWHGLDKVQSKFNEDFEGWQLLDPNGNNPQELSLKSHGEDLSLPGEHRLYYLSGKMSQTNTWYYWVAPEKFLGNWMASSYRLQLWFSLKQSVEGTNASYSDVIISSGSYSLHHSFDALPSTGFRAYELGLDEENGDWRWGSKNGARATREQVRRVFSNVTSFRIRGRYTAGADLEAGIENVTLYQWPRGNGPLISDFTPTAAIPMISVTITGHNFANGSQNNAVYFGGVRANVTNATAQQIAVQVPEGAQFAPITVVNLLNGYAGTTARNFHPIYNNEGDNGGRIVPGSIGKRVDIATEGSSRGLSLADIDGDGLNDIIVSSGGIQIYRNLGVTGTITTESFAPKVTLANGNMENAVADFDGDGKLDIAVVYNTQSSAIVVHRNISTPGNIAFEPYEIFTAPNYSTHGLHAADIDGDGQIDLLATHSSSGITPYLYLFLNVSGEGFIDFAWGRSISAPEFSAASKVITADLDGDKKPEILVQSGFDAKIHVFPNLSHPRGTNFGDAFVIDGPGSVYSMAFADLDGDRKAELIWKGANPDDIHIAINENGLLTSENFARRIILRSPLNHYGGIAIADFNADGKPDIVATDAANLAIFENNFTNGELSEQSFREATVVNIGTTAYPLNPAIADLDGDAKPDIVLAFTSSSRISILRNECFPAPVVREAPLTGVPNGEFTIKGDHLYAGAVKPLVSIAGTNMDVPEADEDELTIKVPANPVYERISVTNHGLTGFSTNKYSTMFNAAAPLDETTFERKADIQLYNAGNNIAVADFNRDGFVDVIVPDIIGTNKARVFKNTTTMPGSPISNDLLVPVDTINANGRFVGVSDIDGDGWQDVIVQGGAHRNAGSADLVFEDRVDGGSGSSSRMKTNLDFDKDGKMDIVVVNGNTVAVVGNRSSKGSFTTGAGVGTWRAAFNMPATGGNVYAIDGADFDLDGFDDFVYGVYSINKIHVVRNKGLSKALDASSFEDALPLDAMARPIAIMTGDFDNDGKPDFAVANQDDGTISIFRNSSSPGLLAFARFDFTVEAKPYDIALADFNGDGKVDIAIAHQTTNTTGKLSILVNTTSNVISFGTPIVIDLPNVPTSIAAADMNGDRKPDILVTRENNTGGGNTNSVLSIFQNNIEIGTGNPQPSCQGIELPVITYSGVSLSSTEGDSYQWFENGSALASETGRTLGKTPVNGKTYAVEVNVGECTVRSADFEFVFTSVSPELYQNVLIYPNPTSGDVVLEVRDFKKSFGVVVLNGQGMQIDAFESRSNTATVSLAEVPSGVYFIRVLSDQKSKTFKVIRAE